MRSWRGASAVSFVFRSAPMSGCRACWLDVADLLVSRPGRPCVDAFAQGCYLEVRAGPSGVLTCWWVGLSLWFDRAVHSIGHEPLLRAWHAMLSREADNKAILCMSVPGVGLLPWPSPSCLVPWVAVAPVSWLETPRWGKASSVYTHTHTLSHLHTDSA